MREEIAPKNKEEGPPATPSDFSIGDDDGVYVYWWFRRNQCNVWLEIDTPRGLLNALFARRRHIALPNVETYRPAL